MNLDDVKYFKIHPAIGVARIANNEDYFEFFEGLDKKFSPASDYMSGGGNGDPEPGKLRIKRQAVQFKIFAYGNNFELLGELPEDFSVKWSAKLGNRKLFNYTSKLGGNVIDPIEGESTASAPDQFVNVEGVSPWDPSKKITLGTISGKGLFIPPKGGVERKSPTSRIAAWPADETKALEATDTTSDGEISVTIYNQTGDALTIPVISAWVVVAPPQHCFTLNPSEAEAMPGNFGQFQPNNANNNNDWIKSTKALLGITGQVFDPTGLDVPMMDTMNADYGPGMEVNLGSSRIEDGVDPKNFFFPRGSAQIEQNEIRIQPHGGQAAATRHGQITSGLCSTWQGDMVACLNYWTAENPNRAFDASGNPTAVIFSEADPTKTMNDTEEINAKMDFRGIVEHTATNPNIRFDMAYDPNRP